MAPLTSAMKAALGLLSANDAQLRGDVWRQTFRLPRGQVIDGQTIKGLARRALARTCGPNRTTFTLTAAGRREALALQNRTAR